MKRHPSNIRLVRIKEDMPTFHLKADDIFEAQLYPLDPDKLTLVVHILSGWRPECNAYKHQIELLPYWKH